MIEHLVARIVELEERLRQSSQNSSRPPSSDAPAVDRPAKRPPSGRRPGGQPGHEGHQRMLLPEDQIDVIVPVKPRWCRRCAAALHGVDATPRRHQVTELPPLQPHVTEYLHFCDRRSYPILDYRALWSLGFAKPPTYTFDF